MRYSIAKGVCCWGLTFVAIAQVGWCDDSDLVLRGKKATVIVVVEGGTGRKLASAFCIHPGGYFVTNGFVVRDIAPPEQLKLVLNAGEPDQKIVPARVIREEKPGNLSLIKAEVENVPALAIDEEETVADESAVTAFGSTSSKLPETAGEFPPISASAGKINKSPRVRQRLDPFRISIKLDPGNSGGPIVNADGKVVGVVGVAIPGGANNSAIPNLFLHKLLEKPETAISIPQVTWASRHKPQKYRVEVIRFGGGTADAQVEFALADPRAPNQWITLPAKKNKSGAFIFTGPVLPDEVDQSLLRAKLIYSEGWLECAVADQILTVGDRKIRMSEIASIDQGEAPSILLVGGEKIPAALPKPTKIPADLGELKFQVDLSRARKVMISPKQTPPSSIRYRVRLTADGHPAEEQTGAIVLEGAPGRPVVTTAAPPVAQAQPTRPAVEKPTVSAVAKVPTGSALAPVRSAAPRPSARDIKLEETPLNDEVVRLPLRTPIDKVVAGGGGRYLFLHLKQSRQLAVYDLNLARIVKNIDLPSNQIQFAAGSDKLLIASVDSNQLQRWNLETLELDLTIAVDFGAALESMALGHSSRGPALFVSRKGLKFYDLDPLQEREMAIPARLAQFTGFFDFTLSGSADGATFVAWQAGGGPGEVSRLSIKDTDLEYTRNNRFGGRWIPNADGSMLLTKSGLFDRDCNPLEADRFGTQICWPTYHPAFFLAAPRFDPASVRNPRRVSVYTMADRRLLLPLNFEELALPQDLRELTNPNVLSLDERIHFYPQSKLLLTIVESRDAIVQRKLDLNQMLKNSGLDFLLVSSIPPSVAIKGKKYSYPLEVQSKRGGVKFKVDSGPAGMKISDRGVVTWNVPAKETGGELSVVIGVLDSAGQKVSHSFVLCVQ